MERSGNRVELDDLGVLRIRGTDAESFLQGQLSNDVTRLAHEGALLAGFHNPQGRTIALLRLVQAGEHDILALLPRELTGLVAQRLTRFILRSKVRITDESAAWSVRGYTQADSPGGIAFQLSGDPDRWISVVAADALSAPGTPGAPRAPRNAWQLLDIGAGLPQIHAQTSELFVAQWLNLDLIDAVSFSKGCYTGQEVIARSHYRGRVKRRTQRWRTIAPAVLAPGDSAQLADGRSLRIVDAAQRADGRCEFLAVAPLAAGTDEEPAPSAGKSASAERVVLEADQLPLPYDDMIETIVK